MKALFANSGAAATPDYGSYVSFGFVVCILLQVVGYENLRTGSRPVVEWMKRFTPKSFPNGPSFTPGYQFIYGAFLASVVIASIVFKVEGSSKAFIYFKF